MNNKQTKSPQSDPLEDLFVDGTEVNRKLLAGLLKNYIVIDKDSHRPIMLGGFNNLSVKQKLLVFLLYKKALLVTGKINTENEPQKPKTISKETGVDFDSTRSYLSQLRSKGFIDKVKGGSYFVPGHALVKIAEELKSSINKNDN